MFSQLSDGLEGVFKKLRGQGKISEKNVSDAMREIRMALLEADVDFSVAKKFVSKVKEEALGEKVLKSITPGQQVVKIFQDSLVDLLGGDAAPLDLDPPARIVMCGLNGAGKTTTSGKLALRLKKEGRKPVLVACDLYRPAAVEQLATLAGEIDVPVYRAEPGEKDVLKVAKKAISWAETQSGNVLIFDTAGRQEIDHELIKELQSLCNFLKPKETLLVADAATGQQSVSVATHFDEAVGLTGIVLTKLDGDARGGAALSMRSVTGKPIKFIGEGEKLENLDVFVPHRLAERILGMGDVVGLVEKAAEAIDEQEAVRMAERMKKSTFDFNDFLAQMKMMQSMGPLEGILGMIPGASKLKGLAGAMDDKKLKRIEAIVLSMTPKERSRPEILNGKRRSRIAKGSGNTITQVNQFLKQFGQMRKMMKSKGKMKKMLSQLGGSGMDLGGLGGDFPKGMKF
ncbi:MAG: signal recognition particle protein [Verrucomicrobiaceae bacterium]|nr:signal recognition particle protein [Verrucomicrobiaceae bacterium]|tara:strand:+ start:2165 stop:3535 length:1371 start_codon:yes stop_codon:yes gene_type:complete